MCVCVVCVYICVSDTAPTVEQEETAFCWVQIKVTESTITHRFEMMRLFRLGEKNNSATATLHMALIASNEVMKETPALPDLLSCSARCSACLCECLAIKNNWEAGLPLNLPRVPVMI